MKSPFDHLDRLLEHSSRLHIMSVLVANDSFEYKALKELLGLTDGNLATHIKMLEREKYLVVIKSFVDRKPNTKYRITEKGRAAFRKHLDAMAELIRVQKKLV